MRVKRLFRSPLLFPPKPPEADGTWANNPSRPASFLRQLRPSTAPLPAFFAAKRGFFAPNTRRTRRFRPPERPVLPRSRPVFARRAPEKDPAVPVFARDPGAFADPWTPGSPLVCGFLPARARFCRRPPPFFRQSARRKPRRRRKTARQASRPARCRRPPPEGQSAAPPRHSLGARQPRLPWSAFLLRRGEVCTPRGDQIPGHDG